MNYLTAIEKVSEIIGEHGDDFILKQWFRKIGEAENPELVIENLKKTAKAANEFWEWSEKITPTCVQGSVRNAQNTGYTSILLGVALETEKAEFYAKLQEDLASIN